MFPVERAFQALQLIKHFLKIVALREVKILITPLSEIGSETHDSGSARVCCRVAHLNSRLVREIFRSGWFQDCVLFFWSRSWYGQSDFFLEGLLEFFVRVCIARWQVRCRDWCFRSDGLGVLACILQVLLWSVLADSDWTVGDKQIAANDGRSAFRLV